LKRKVYVILRVFCKTENYKKKVIEKIENLLKIGVDYIVIVVYSLDTQNTAEEIEKVFSGKNVSVLKNHNCFAANHWSRGLNIGLQYLENYFKPSDNDLLLVISNEVTLTKETFFRMLHAMTPRVGVVGVKLPGNGSSYEIPRNTLALWLLKKVINTGYFSEWCDEAGGMEDYKKLNDILELGLGFALLEFSDTTLEILDPARQKAKEEREVNAMKIIDQSN
jgi:hypothetical protein